MATAVKLLLRSLAVVAILGAALGTWAILADWQGRVELRVVLTAATILGACLCAVAYTPWCERQQTVGLSLGGLALTGVAALLLLVCIWGNLHDRTFGWLTLSLAVFAVAGAHFAQLARARLAPSQVWLVLLAAVSVFTLAALISGAVMSDLAAFATKPIGVFSFVVACVTILIRVCHHMCPPELPLGTDAPTTGPVVTVPCPWCGAARKYPLGQVTCPKCQTVFVVRVVCSGPPASR